MIIVFSFNIYISYKLLILSHLRFPRWMADNFSNILAMIPVSRFPIHLHKLDFDIQQKNILQLCSEKSNTLFCYSTCSSLLPVLCGKQNQLLCFQCWLRYFFLLADLILCRQIALLQYQV